MLLDDLRRDLRHALAGLRRNPGFAAAALLTLALGIGANSAAFSAVRTILLAPLPFPDSERLVRLMRLIPREDGGVVRGSLTPLQLHAVRDESGQIERAAGQRFRALTLTGGGEPERVTGIGVSDGWLETLGVLPRLGRGFDAAEQRDGSDSRVVLLSHGFWTRRFGASPGIVGRHLRLDEEEYTVVGVMPPQFRYPYEADLWLPLSIPPEPDGGADLNAAARIHPGVGSEQLAAELEAISARLRERDALEPGARIAAHLFSEEFERDPDQAVLALQLAVGFVLLIASANVASLLLARGASRRRELAVRAALGAGRGRQLRQLLTESLLLAGLGGAAGLALATPATRMLAALIPPRLGEVVQQIQVDPWVLAFSLVVSVLAGVGFGLGPALHATRGDVAGALRTGSRSAGSGRGLDGLVVAEVALAAVLLVAAGLMTRSLAQALDADVGYEPERLVKLDLALPRPRYDAPEHRAELIRRLEERLNAEPGVAAAGVTSLQPIPRTRTNTGARIALPESAPEAVPVIANLRLVGPGWFEAIGLPALRGRALAASDAAGAEPVAVVSTSLAAQLWPGRSPIGERLTTERRDDPDAVWLRVVGEVPDIAEPATDLPGTIYRPYPQATATQPAGRWWTTSVALMVRVRSGEPGATERLRRAVWSVDPGLPVFDSTAMADVLAEPLEQRRLGSALVLGFGAFGLLMAALGTYGLMSFAVARRRRELGVRLALGATPGALQRRVLGEALGRVGLGLGLGAAGAVAVTRLLHGAIAGLPPADLPSLALAASALLASGLVASWLPARRAARTDPLVALRDELD